MKAREVAQTKTTTLLTSAIKLRKAKIIFQIKMLKFDIMIKQIKKGI